MNRWARRCGIFLVFLIAAAVHGAVLHTDIEYARPDGVSLKLDVISPDAPGPHPAIILVHGGAFVEGHRQGDVKHLFDPLTKLGLTVFTIDYRLAPKFMYPAAVEDVEAAIRWVKANAARYQADAGRLGILGVSAGGSLVSMAIARGKLGCEVSAVVLFYAINDVLRTFDPKQTSEKMRIDRSRFYGVREVNAENESFLRAASPYYNLRMSMPPYLLLHGTDDPRVDYPQSVAMCKKLTEMGNRCELITIAGGGHGNWKDTSWKQKLLSWLSTQLGQEASRGREPAQ